jgi:hypothetical protein
MQNLVTLKRFNKKKERTRKPLTKKRKTPLKAYLAA